MRAPRPRRSGGVPTRRAHTRALGIVLAGLALTLSLAGAAAAQTNTVEPDGVIRGEYPVAAARDDITPQERSRIQAQVAANVARLRAQGVLAPPEAGGPRQPPTVLLDWPLAPVISLTDPGYHGVSNFVDQDLTTDANPNINDPATIEDYNCGDRTYDTTTGYNHSGIDYFLWPYSWNKMDAQLVDAIAAAAGTIVAKDDGNYDRQCGFGTAPANYVILQHSDSSYAWYFHLKNGSVTTKTVGQSVALGEYIGKVGSSGSSTGPHLHFEVHNSADVINEPYDGPCNVMNPGNSWWNVQRPYYDSAVNRLSTGTAAPVFPACPNPEITNEQDVFNPGATVYFTIFFRDILSTDTYTFTIRRPDSSVHYTNTFAGGPDPHYAGAFYSFFFSPFAMAGPTGTWTFEIVYNTVTYTHLFQLQNGPIPTPTATLTPPAVPTKPASSTPTRTATPTPTRTATPTLTPAAPTTTATATPTATPTPGPAPTCATGPIAGCRTPDVGQKAILLIKDKSPDDKDLVIWKWIKGSVTVKADFGVPTTTTNYQLCIYDGTPTNILGAAIPAGGLCNVASPKACWQDKPTGFKYKDKDLTPDGIDGLILKEGLVTAKAKIILKGKGQLLDDPTIPIANSPVTVQLLSGDGVCWEAVYSAPFLKNTAGPPPLFKDKAD